MDQWKQGPLAIGPLCHPTVSRVLATSLPITSALHIVSITLHPSSMTCCITSCLDRISPLHTHLSLRILTPALGVVLYQEKDPGHQTCQHLSRFKRFHRAASISTITIDGGEVRLQVFISYKSSIFHPLMLRSMPYSMSQPVSFVCLLKFPCLV